VLGLKQNAKGVGLNTGGRKIIAYVEELASQKVGIGRYAQTCGRTRRNTGRAYRFEG